MNRKASSLSVLLLALTFTAQYVSAQRNTLFGQVVEVLDGKTVVMQAPGGRVNAELQFIDVPPATEPMNEVIKEHLSKLVMGKNVQYRIKNLLPDGSIGRLTIGDTDVSQQMLRDGAAWHVPAALSGQDSSDFQLYAITEAAAKAEKRGIWAFPDLKPTWERPVASVSHIAPDPIPVPSVPATAKQHGPWGDKNPRFGDIGALMNGYNAQLKQGYLSTSLLPVEMKDTPFDGKFGLDVTYLYKENEGNTRQGLYIFTLVCESPKVHFLKDNNVYVVYGEKKLNLGRAEYSVKSSAGVTRETLKYRISRETLEKLVNTDEAYLKAGSSAIFLANVRYLVYNMLQLTN